MVQFFLTRKITSLARDRSAILDPASPQILDFLENKWEGSYAAVRLKAFTIRNPERAGWLTKVDSRTSSLAG